MDIQINTGDLIELGNHRLLCGDSTEPNNLSKLLIGNEKIDMICADAPYGVGYVEGKQEFAKAIQGESETMSKHKAIANDGLIQDYHSFSMKWLSPAVQHLNKKNTFYLFNGDTKMQSRISINGTQTDLNV